jgi:energy-coupling factor transport system substrate-specific component
VPAVLSSLIIRKPGAALFTETVAAAVSVLLGSPYGTMAIVQGAVQGLGTELGFAATRYRSYRPATAALAGALGGLAATLFDALYWYPKTDWITFRLPYIAIGVLSCLVVAGLGSVASPARWPAPASSTLPAGANAPYLTTTASTPPR